MEEKTNAEARLEKLEREHANALAANTLTPPSPLLSSASMQMSAVPEDPGPIINLAMVAPPLALDTPTRDLIPTTPEGTENAARTHRHSSTQQSPSPSAVHPQEMHASLGASRSTPSSDNDSDSESEDIMIALHDDYTACLRKLKTLQMKLDMALKKMFIPTTGMPTVNPEHDAIARGKVVKVIENSVRETYACLEQRILGPSAHRTIKMGSEQYGDIAPTYQGPKLIPSPAPPRLARPARFPLQNLPTQLDAQRVTTSGTTQTYSLVAKMPVPKPLHHDAEERSSSYHSGWLTEDDEDSSGHKFLENISVKRSSGRTSPTDRTLRFDLSPPTSPWRRSYNGSLYLEHGSFAVLDDPGSAPLLADEEAVDKESSVSEVSEDGRGGDRNPSIDLEEYKEHLDMLTFLNQHELAQARREQAEIEARQVTDNSNAEMAGVETSDSLEVIDTDVSERFESVDNIVPPSTADRSGSMLRNWFVPKNGINRQVISADIQKYLGIDATVRPGQDRVDGSEVWV